MISSKPFKTYRQQLAILRKRNLSIPNGSKAIKILKREGYYNIINGYKGIFMDAPMSKQTGDDYYKTGVSFEHIYALYDFDRNLRTDLIKYILKMETNLKTKIAYSFSQHYKQNFSYLDINNFDATDPQRVTKLIARISSVITNNSQKQDQGGQIYHYLEKYKELPLWVLVKKMTLGETYHFFEALQPNIKDEIVTNIIEDFEKEYKCKLTIPSNLPGQILIMLRFINKFRNICAHDERLFNTQVKDNKGRLPGIIHFHYRSKSLVSKAKLFDCILILGLFISKKDYKVLISKITNEIESLGKKLPQNLFNLVLIEMGFPKDWRTKLIL